MTIGQKQLHINGITWHCLSIFYAREHIAVLLNAIKDFCESNKKELKHWSMYFSKEQGERINLVFISEEQHSKTFVVLTEQFFERFLKENPSERLEPIPYGFMIWMPYPNNSLVWNSFHIPHFLFANQEIRDFCQESSLLITHLYDAESSYIENVPSIATFLSVQIQKLQNITLPATSDPELAETLQSYWEYEDEEGLLTTWLQHATGAEGTFIIRFLLDLLK